MKRLFAVRDNSGKLFHGEDGKPAYFNNKEWAKEFRDAQNKNKKGSVAFVTRGPDHMGKHSGHRVPRMRRQPPHRQYGLNQSM